MSTYYRPTEPIPLEKIKTSEGLGEQGFEVIQSKEGNYFKMHVNYLHFATDKEDNVIDVFRYGANTPDDILDALECEFDVVFYSEYEDEYHELACPDTPVRVFKLAD